jgi:hypothetical protein
MPHNLGNLHNPPPFTAYQLDDAYDEMFTPDGIPRRSTSRSTSGCSN